MRHEVALGRSVRGRPIDAVALGDPDARRRLLVIGAIHGDESAGIAIARDLTADPPPRAGAIWTIPDLNPDGVAADTRQNARGVDLNRSFPWHWRPLRIERRFARLAHLPLRRLRRYPGGAASRQNHRPPTTTAFVVELPPGRPLRALVERDSNAVRTLLRRFGDA